MSRREFPARVRALAAKRSNGFCEGEGCGVELRVGGYHYDHDVPDGLGGEPTLENCRVLCRPCHDEKTRREDVPRIAKADAQRNHIVLGIKRQSRPIAGSRASGLKKKFDGTVERRS